MPTVLIIGAGHAGLEAAFAARRVGVDVRVVTGRVDTIGQTPCNPSVGGVAKGHLVKEIDALGGFMGRAADAVAIHGRVLNRSKGPAVRATRLQVDKQRYGDYARTALTTASGIEVVEGLAVGLCIEDGRCVGVTLADGARVTADAVVVTTGTFLGGILHTGSTRTPGGRAGEAAATGLAQHLAALGFSLKRLKTGTPPRLDGRTVNPVGLEVQPSEEPIPRFTPSDEDLGAPRLQHVDCWLTWTNERTHDVIRKHLHLSPMYSGQIEGRGPRYCPAVEDKIVRFGDRPRHQVFLEPEGLDTDSVYPNGISTALPADVQAEMVATIPGLEDAKMLRPGYAVEYDAVDARALTHSLASKDHEGLFFAGQVNGTSGYEEAGVQGLVAGANAALWLLEREPLEVSREQGYTGVLIDDLVTQGCDEPYRMFTSRAEYRIVLREDNADVRLVETASAAGLLSPARRDAALARGEQTERIAVEMRKHKGPDETRAPIDAPQWLLDRAGAQVLYEGYARRIARDLSRIRGETGDMPLPTDLKYEGLPGLSHEAAQRLAAVRPVSVAQAARIRGITPAAVLCVWAHARNLRARRPSS